MKKTKKFLSIFAILFVAIFALSCCFFAACGSKDNDDDDTKIEDTTTTEPENPSTPEEPEEPETPDTATVEKVELDKLTLDLVVGGEDGTLTATVTMSDGSDYTGSYTWASSATSVATVTGNGATATVIAISAGSARITVAVDDDKTATCEVTVTETDPYTDVGTEEELGKALETKSYIRITNDITVNSTVSIETNVTIDLNGKSIQTEDLSNEQFENAYNTMTINENGYLTVVDNSVDGDGSIENSYTGNTSADNAAAIYSEGNVVLEGGTVKSDSVGIRAKAGYVVVDGGNIESVRYTIWTDAGNVTVIVLDGKIQGSEKGIFLGGDNGNFGISYDEVSKDAVSTLYVCGGEIICDTESAICTLGRTSPESVEIYIYDGEITGMEEMPAEQTATGAAPAIFMASGNLCVEGGTITGTTAIEVRGGTTMISGGTIKTTGDPLPEDGKNAQNTEHGATTYGYSLAVFPYGSGVTVERGSSDIDITDPVTVEVSGGTFMGAVYGVTQEVWEEESSSYTWQEYTFSITGGTFTGDPSEFVAEGYKVDGNQTSGYTVVKDESMETEGNVLTYTMSSYFTPSVTEETKGLTSGKYYNFGNETYTESDSKEGVLSYYAGSGSKFGTINATVDETAESFSVYIQNGGGCGNTGSNKRYYIVDLSKYAGQNATIEVYATTNSDGSARDIWIAESVNVQGTVESAGSTSSEDSKITPITKNVECGTNPFYIYSNADLRVFQIVVTFGG